MGETKESSGAGMIVVIIFGVCIFVMVVGNALSNNAPQQPSTASQPVAAVPAEDPKAREERIFKSDVDSAAAVILRKALIKKTWGKLPENFYARGEMLKREGSRALVLVRSGIKEGLLSEPVYINNYLVALQYGDPDPNQFTWNQGAGIVSCGEQPTDRQIKNMLVSNLWPGAVNDAWNKAGAKLKRHKRVAVAEDSE